MEVLVHGSKMMLQISSVAAGNHNNRRKLLVTRAAAAPVATGAGSSGNLNLELSGEWQESQGRLLGLGLSQEESSRVLGKASGVVKSPYWGASKEKRVPPVECVDGIVEYLVSLGLSNADISTVLKKFPELLGCKLEAEVKRNVGLLDSTWGISGATLKSLILRKPDVLGYNVDCKGDCMAECTRCWARF